MANVVFKRGAQANLDTVSKVDGQILFTLDEGHIYLDIEGGQRVELYADDIKNLTDAINKLTATSGDGSISDIVAKELAKALIPEDAKESLNELEEIAAWIQSHPDDVATMNAAIQANKDTIDALLAGMGTTDPDDPEAPVEVKSVKDVVDEAINDLDVTDTAEDGKYIASVSQQDGKINVVRKDLPTTEIAWGDFGAITPETPEVSE